MCSERMRDAVERVRPSDHYAVAPLPPGHPPPLRRRRERTMEQRPSSDERCDDGASTIDQLARRSRTWRPAHGPFRWRGKGIAVTWRVASAASSIIVGSTGLRTIDAPRCGGEVLASASVDAGAGQPPSSEEGELEQRLRPQLSPIPAGVSSEATGCHLGLGRSGRARTSALRCAGARRHRPRSEPGLGRGGRRPTAGGQRPQ